MSSRPPISGTRLWTNEIVFLAILIALGFSVFWGTVALATWIHPVEWTALGQGAWVVQWTAYALPFVAGTAAVAISGVVGAARKEPQFPWKRLGVSIGLFWIVAGAGGAVAISSIDATTQELQDWANSAQGMLPAYLLVAPTLAGLVATGFARAVTFRDGDDSAIAHYNRGVDLLNAQAYEQAIAAFTRSIELWPGHAVAFANRGYALSLLGRYEQAIADYTAAIRLGAPDVVVVYRLRSEAYRAIGDLESAARDARRATQG